MVSKDDNVTISYLADYFSVSHMTIRRDVEELQNNGVVKVIFGGQIVKNFIENSPEYSNKSRENTDYKKAVVLKAYKLLRPQQTVFMDGGTTVKQLSGLIDMPLTVLTNDISTAGLLNENELIRVILCPGKLRGKVYRPTAVKHYAFSLNIISISPSLVLMVSAKKTVP